MKTNKTNKEHSELVKKLFKPLDEKTKGVKTDVDWKEETVNGIRYHSDGTYETIEDIYGVFNWSPFGEY